MNISQVKHFFSVDADAYATIEDSDTLIIELLKVKFGYPLSENVEELGETITFSEEQTMGVYKSLLPRIKNKEFESLSILFLEMNRILDRLVEAYLDEE